MTTEQMRNALSEKGYVSTSYKPSLFHLPVLAVHTPDPQSVIDDMIEVFHYCPEYEWRVIHGHTILWFPYLTV